MSSGWSWSFFPARLFSEPAFLELDMVDRGFLFTAYARCDRFGRGPAHPIALRAALAVFDGSDPRASFDRLAAAGLVDIYRVGGKDFWQLAGYDDDAPAELLRRRGSGSQFPPPPGTTPPPAPECPPTPDAASSAPDTCQAPPVASEPPARPCQALPDARQAAPGNVTPRREEKRRDRDESTVPEGGPVAARAPAHPPAPARTHEAGSVPAAPPAPPSPARPVSESRWPVPAEPAWPDGTEEAGREWWARLQVERPMGCGYVLADIQRLAARHGAEAFVAGVADHVGGARGWKRTDPVAWLDRQCTFAAERLADKRTRRAVADADLPAMRKPQPVFADWSFRWELPEGDPRLDPLWPSAQDLPLEDQIPLARCAHTPEGPIEPPRPLAEVAGALDEYRRRYGDSAAHAAGGAA